MPCVENCLGQSSRPLSSPQQNFCGCSTDQLDDGGWRSKDAVVIWHQMYVGVDKVLRCFTMQAAGHHDINLVHHSLCYVEPEDCTFPVVVWQWLGDRDCTAQYNCCLPATTDCRRFCLFRLILYGSPAMSWHDSVTLINTLLSTYLLTYLCSLVYDSKLL